VASICARTASGLRAGSATTTRADSTATTDELGMTISGRQSVIPEARGLGAGCQGRLLVKSITHPMWQLECHGQ
jgi:hypothetical protein